MTKNMDHRKLRGWKSLLSSPLLIAVAVGILATAVSVTTIAIYISVVGNSKPLLGYPLLIAVAVGILATAVSVTIGLYGAVGNFKPLLVSPLLGAVATAPACLCYVTACAWCSLCLFQVYP